MDMPFFKGTAATRATARDLKGRQGAYEVMFMTPSLRKLILQNVGAAEIKDAAVEGGMLTLRMDGCSRSGRASPRWNRSFARRARDGPPRPHRSVVTE
jgi:type II secretory ATPase GspE/PulE/Tfp pilus assembly ATPase PilB-like protein